MRFSAFFEKKKCCSIKFDRTNVKTGKAQPSRASQHEFNFSIEVFYTTWHYSIWFNTEWYDFSREMDPVTTFQDDYATRDPSTRFACSG